MSEGKSLEEIECEYYLPDMNEIIMTNDEEIFTSSEAFWKVLDIASKYKITDICSELKCDFCIKIIHVNHFFKFEYIDEEGDECEYKLEFYGSTKLQGLERTSADLEAYISKYRIDYRDYFKNMMFLLKKQTEFKLPIFGSCNHCKFPQFINEDGLCRFHQKKKDEEKVEKEQPPKGYIYVVEDEKDICKIGFSTKLPEKRNQQLSVTYHKDFLLRGYLPSQDPLKQEKEIHRKLDKYRIKGEWFKLSYEEIKDKTGLNFVESQVLTDVAPMANVS